MQSTIETEVADRFNHSRENKSEREDQSSAVVCASETHQGICGVAKADESAANLKIQIALWGTSNADLPQVHYDGKKQGYR